METTEVQRYSKTAYLDAGITTELFVAREMAANLLPAATCHLALANLVVQQAEISHNTSIVSFKDERVGNAKLLRRLGIVKQELVKVFVAAVKGNERIVRSKGYESHTITNTIQF